MVQRQSVFELVRPRISACVLGGLFAAATGCGGGESDARPAAVGGATSDLVAGSGAGGISSTRSVSGGRSQLATPSARGGEAGAGTGASGGSFPIEVVQGTLGNPKGQGGAVVGGTASGGTNNGATNNGSALGGSGGDTKSGGLVIGGKPVTISSGSGAGNGSTTPRPSSGGTGSGGQPSQPSGSARGGQSSVAGAAPNGGTAVGTSSAVAQGGTPTTTTTTGTNTGGTPVGAAAVAEFTTAYVTPYCKRLAECCTRGGFAPPAAATCEEHELGFYSDSLGDGTATVNASGISALLGAIQTSCDQPSYLLYGQLTAGTKPIGADCTDVSQCQGDNVLCIVPQNSEVGKCVAATRGKLGDACAVDCDNTSICKWSVLGGKMSLTAACWDEDGLRCDSQTNTCVALAGIGKVCDFIECGRHAECHNDICVTKGKLGEDCQSRGCESTLICNTNYKCEKMSIAWSGSCGS